MEKQEKKKEPNKLFKFFTFCLLFRKFYNRTDAIDAGASIAVVEVAVVIDTPRDVREAGVSC